MKRLVLTATIFLFLGGISFAQTAEKQQIRTQFMDYFELLMKGNYSSAFDYMPDEFFNYVPKDQLLEITEATFNSPMFAITLKNPKINSIGDLRTVQARRYSRMNYSMNMMMKMKQLSEDAAVRTNQINTLTTNFEASFGKDGVSFDEATSTFIVTITRDVIAINSNTEAWKFMEIDPNQMSVISEIVPAEILNQN